MCRKIFIIKVSAPPRFIDDKTCNTLYAIKLFFSTTLCSKKALKNYYKYNKQQKKRIKCVISILTILLDEEKVYRSGNLKRDPKENNCIFC